MIRRSKSPVHNIYLHIKINIVNQTVPSCIHTLPHSDYGRGTEWRIWSSVISKIAPWSKVGINAEEVNPQKNITKGVKQHIWVMMLLTKTQHLDGIPAQKTNSQTCSSPSRIRKATSSKEKQDTPGYWVSSWISVVFWQRSGQGRKRTGHLNTITPQIRKLWLKFRSVR